MEATIFSSKDAQFLAKGYCSFEELMYIIKGAAAKGLFICQVYLLSEAEISQLKELGYEVRRIVNSKGLDNIHPRYEIIW